jgi:hypothetical protein
METAPEWQTHSRPETGPSPAACADARTGPLQPHRHTERLHNVGDLRRHAGGSCGFSQITAWLRYDLSKLRAKGLVEKVPRSRRYRLLREGYPICLVFLKLFERIYAPLTAGVLSPVSGDSKLQHQKRCQLDRLYQRVIDDLHKLMDAVGLKAA